MGQQIAIGAKTVLPGEQVRSFMDKEVLLSELKQLTNDQTIILVKASRGMKLEEIVMGLQKTNNG
jgi:UDP-N-acetylmuramoyl-tripeptide--D-alanyl-D-alanine ligase